MSTASLELASRIWRPPPLVLNDGSLEMLKWGALVLMTLDHVNKYLLHDSSPVLFDLGRVVMPIFAIVLGYNLARVNSGAYGRVAMRLSLAGLAATPAFIGLGGLGWGWWPLNVMSTLLAATVVCGLLDAGGALRALVAISVFLVVGSSVEFWWPGIGICVCAWAYARRPRWMILASALTCIAALVLVNKNMWALGGVPLVWCASKVPLLAPRPRLRLFFYAYYPAHLVAIWALGRLMIAGTSHG